MAERDFLDILGDCIRKDLLHDLSNLNESNKTGLSKSSHSYQSQSFDPNLRPPIKTESPSDFQKTENQLLGQVEKLVFSQKFSSTTYRSFKRPPIERMPHQLSPIQNEAFQFLSNWGTNLAPNFSPSDLKKAFRKAALRLHPDRGGDASLFLKLNTFKKILENLF